MFNKTKNYQQYYSSIFEDKGFGHKNVGKRVLLFRSKDGEKVRRMLERQNKGLVVTMLRIGKEVGLPRRVAEQFGVEVENIGDI